MKYNDLQDKCKECEYMKPWSIDMGGNHGCMCEKHQLNYFNKRTGKCDEYKQPISEQNLDYLKGEQYDHQG